MEPQPLIGSRSSTSSDISQRLNFEGKVVTVEAADRHRRASRITQYVEKTKSSSDPTQPDDCCECCGYPVDAPLISIRCKLDTLSHLGTAVPLYFYLNRNIMFMLLIVSLAAIPATVNNLSGGSDSSVPLVRLTIVGHDDSFQNWPMVLHMVAIILLCCFYVNMTFRMKRKMLELDLRYERFSHFAVMIKNLGKSWKISDLKEHIEKNMGTGFEVEDINVCYDVIELGRIAKSISKLRQKQLQYYKQIQPQPLYLRIWNSITCKTPITQNQIEIDKSMLNTRIEEMRGRQWRQIGVAIVTLKTDKQVKVFIAKWKKHPMIRCMDRLLPSAYKSLRFNRKWIYVKEAPEPNDVLWENLRFSRLKRIMIQIVTVGFVIGILVLDFLILFMIAGEKAIIQISKSEDDAGHHSRGYYSIMSWSCSLWTALLNIVLKYVSRLLSTNEHHNSHTNESLFVAWKLVIFLSFNMTLFPLIVNLLLFGSEFADGLSPDVFTNVMVQTLLMPFMKFLLPLVWAGIRYYYRRKLAKSPYLSTQISLNEYFEYTDPDITSCYIFLICNLILTLSYTAFLPIIAPVMFVGTVVDYWVTKFVLLRLSRKPRPLSYPLAELMMQFVKMAIMLYGFGAMLSLAIMKDPWLAAGSTAFSISFLFWCIPVSCFRLCFRSPMFLEQKKVKEYKQELVKCLSVGDDYESANPVTNVQKLINEDITLQKLKAFIYSQGERPRMSLAYRFSPQSQPQDQQPKVVDDRYHLAKAGADMSINS